MNHAKKLLFGLLAMAVTTAIPTGPRAAELVMVEEDGCPWCDRWNAEIGVIYDRTDEGRIAPLRRVDLHALPGDIAFATRPRYSPTFVLMEAGVEIGRIEGHPGEDFFWPLLNRLLDRLPKAPADGS